MRAKGVNYEAKAQKYLSKFYGPRYVPAPWFQFMEAGDSRIGYCQPDGLLFANDLSQVTIVEIKLRHTDQAWWQLRHKYGPVLKYVYPWMRIAYCELVQWYDIAIPFPEAVELRPQIGLARPGPIQVTIWKP